MCIALHLKQQSDKALPSLFSNLAKLVFAPIFAVIVAANAFFPVDAVAELLADAEISTEGYASNPSLVPIVTNTIAAAIISTNLRVHVTAIKTRRK